ncbi:MAG: RCC1 domain-containing protein [Solirubrobacteraceae bacterium]
MLTARLRSHPAAIRARSGRRRLALLAALLCGLVLASTTGTASAATVASGADQSCAIKGDGGVWCWGSARYGLGDGTTTQSAVPVRVHGLTAAEELAVGDGYACARRTDRTVWCWGYNGDGQLGDGTTTDAPTPVPVVGIGDAVAIAVGAGHGCAVRAGGRVACWGDNGSGRLGDGSETDSSVPVAVSGITDARSVTAGEEHTCATLRTGSVRCWGDNGSGRLGDGTNVDERLVPSGDLPGLTDAVAVVSGNEHSCAVRAGGTASCWGNNGNGRLGDGTTDDRSVPTPVAGLAGVTALDGGDAFTCAVTADGGSRCWGANGNGQLGDGSGGATSSTPVAVPGAPAATEIAGGDNHVCIRGVTSEVRCWGSGVDGQLGNGRTARAADPTAVTGLHAATAVTVGYEASCALLDTGSISCWGRNRYAELGTGTKDLAPTPAPVVGITDATSVTNGTVHACALHGSGPAHGRRISCWGDNWIGQLGAGQPGLPGTPAEASSPLPVDLSPVFADFADPAGVRATALTTGETFNCALLAPAGNEHGSVWCWGAGGAGQIGNGQLVTQGEPVKVDRPIGFLPVAAQDSGATIASGAGHTCAVSSVGHRQVWCWGSNSQGQLGDGTTTNRQAPKQVPGLDGVRSLASGDHHTCALLDAGAVRCWGYGAQGALGDGQSTNSLVPVDAQITGVTALAAGGGQTCATLADGTLSCWGARFDGRFHDGQHAADQSTPSPAPGLTGVTAVALGTRHACVTTAGGTARCWGAGLFGQLGDGPMPGGHYPVQRTPTRVIGFDPRPAPPVDGPPGSTLPPVLVPPLDPPGNPPAGPPARPRALTVELRDARLSLRGLTLARAKKAKTCPRTAKATISARVTVRSAGRRVARTVKTTRTIRLERTTTACRTTATVKLTGRLAKAKKVRLVITGKGLRTSRRTVTARWSATLRATTVRLDRLVVRSTRKDVCPARATVTVTGGTKATRKRRTVKRNVPVRLAPTANCRITTTVRLPRALRKVRAVTVTVQATGLRTTRRTLRVG